MSTLNMKRSIPQSTMVDFSKKKGLKREDNLSQQRQEVELLNKRDLIGGKHNSFNQSQNNIYRQYNALIDVVGSAAQSQVSLDRGLFSKVQFKEKQQQMNQHKIKSHTVMKGNLGTRNT